MTGITSAQLNREIALRYGNPEGFRYDVLHDIALYGISKRQLALRAGLCYTHVLKVLNGKVTPRLTTMLYLDEALEQLINDTQSKGANTMKDDDQNPNTERAQCEPGCNIPIPHGGTCKTGDTETPDREKGLLMQAIANIAEGVENPKSAAREVLERLSVGRGEDV